VMFSKPHAVNTCRNQTTMREIQLQPFSIDRMVRAVEKVRQRLLRSTAVLEKAGVPYAVVGGYAVAAWMARVDIAAVRNTQDVDLLVWRNDFDRAKASLEAAGFMKPMPAPATRCAW